MCDVATEGVTYVWRQRSVGLHCCCNWEARPSAVVEGPQASAAAAAAPPPGGVCAADIFACWDLVRHPTGSATRSFHPPYCNHVPTDCAADINSCPRMSFLALESNSWQVRHCSSIWVRGGEGVCMQFELRSLFLDMLIKYVTFIC
jgi:hypothetical protein